MKVYEKMYSPPPTSLANAKVAIILVYIYSHDF